MAPEEDLIAGVGVEGVDPAGPLPGQGEDEVEAAGRVPLLPADVVDEVGVGEQDGEEEEDRYPDRRLNSTNLHEWARRAKITCR